MQGMAREKGEDLNDGERSRAMSKATGSRTPSRCAVAFAVRMSRSAHRLGVENWVPSSNAHSTRYNCVSLIVLRDILT